MADRDDVPEDFDGLLGFVRHHLVQLLDDEERPWLVGSLLEDLEAEAEVARLGPDAMSSARMAVATRIPDKLRETEPAPMSLSLDGEPITQSSDPPQIPRLAPMPMDLESVARLKIDRPAVLVVDQDRFGRASLCRALVQGRCDVTSLDAGPEAIAAIEGPEPIDLLLIDVDTTGASSVLETLVRIRPDTAVIAWTKSPAAIAEHVMRVAGVRLFEVLARNTRPAVVNETIRKLV
ncbi:MAG: hypothetical protein ACXVEE_32170 [Polyangiales bacterium]